MNLDNIINNKLLEGNTTPSPASSTDDYWNASDSKNVGIPDAINDVNFDAPQNQQNKDELNMENPNKKDTYPNRIHDEATVWYQTQLNPISRYRYEVKWKSQEAAMSFAWGERMRPDNQKDYFTIEQIIEYFSKENRLDYLKDIGYTNYLKEINYPHMWMFEM